MKRVAITGIGAVTPLSNNFTETWRLVKKGRSGISSISVLDSTLRPPDNAVKAVGAVREIKPDRLFSKKELNFLDPVISYAVVAASEALINSGLSLKHGDTSAAGGVIIGSSRGGIISVEKELLKLASSKSTPGRNAVPRVSPHLMPASTVSAAASNIGTKLNITGYMLGISNACASGANAIGEAFRMIRNGGALFMLAGGSEAPLCRICLEGYRSAKALSKGTPESASRPFDSHRDGFVLAEGACVMVLEEMLHALKRKATILGEITGYGNAFIPTHLTLPSVDNQILAIGASLDDAGTSAAEIDYVNAHATSTIAGDRVEASALRKIFGKRQVPVSALKSMTGHMLSASGAFEAACTAMSLCEGIIPPSINTRDIAPDCEIYLIKKPIQRPIKAAISNSFGFGGVNAVLTIRRFDPA